jgi:HD-GYP domain-containing protein (c-di-GMP phosphodiesterase class II)
VVVELAMAMGRTMGLPRESLGLLEEAAMVHNVGYIALDRDTVLKPSTLTDTEISAIKDHPRSGVRIVKDADSAMSVADIVLCHHESPDGMGYPRGLKGSDIPIEAAIIKVAEAFAAMTSPRAYRGSILTEDDALGEIARSVGAMFDPWVAYFLFKMKGRDDLCCKVLHNFGRPSEESIRARLSTGNGWYEPGNGISYCFSSVLWCERDPIAGACVKPEHD